MILIDYAQTNRNKKVDVMSESYPHLEDGAIKDFKEIMIDREYWNDGLWNSTRHTYTFETGTVVKFISIDKLGKAHGPRRDVLFMNEANNISFNIYEQLEVRTKEIIWLDWNPTSEFWYYEHIKNKIDHDFLTLTYLDCLDALDYRIVESIESRKNRKGWWTVYGLGQLGEVEGKIYKDWNIIDEIPHEARLERFGLDFGYSNDETALVAIYYYNGGYILDELLFSKGLKNKQIADAILETEEVGILTVADSAEPKSIDEIKDEGVSIIGCRKSSEGSRDSYVKWSIGIVQSQKISMTSRSINLIKDYRNYLWQVDKDGKVLNVPEHDFSNTMDAVRYGIVSLIKPPKKSVHHYTPNRIGLQTVKRESLLDNINRSPIARPSKGFNINNRY